MFHIKYYLKYEIRESKNSFTGEVEGKLLIVESKLNSSSCQYLLKIVLFCNFISVKTQ